MKLIALRCPHCHEKLAPQSNEAVVVFCGSCHTAVRLSQQGIAQLPVQYVASSSPTADAWLPFWVFHGRVNLKKRDSQNADKQAQKEAQALWQRVQRLYAPAWEMPTAQARELGRQLVQAQPAFQTSTQAPSATIAEATINPEDALKLLDFIVLTIEAERKDWLRDLQFAIESDNHELWVMPARKKGTGWEFIGR